MRPEGLQRDVTRCSARRRRFAVIPAFAIFGSEATWLEGTALALGAVLILGALAAALVAAGRHFRWWSAPELIRLKRTLRIAFGALLLAALTIPYLLLELPMLAVALVLFGGLACIPYLTAPTGENLSRSEHSTGEHAELE